VFLEDDASFNAGTGAALTSEGEVELDASCMDGTTLRAGAVACVKTLKNPDPRRAAGLRRYAARADLRPRRRGVRAGVRDPRGRNSSLITDRSAPAGRSCARWR